VKIAPSTSGNVPLSRNRDFPLVNSVVIGPGERGRRDGLVAALQPD
jgi:hypothetical protein